MIANQSDKPLQMKEVFKLGRFSATDDMLLKKVSELALNWHAERLESEEWPREDRATNKDDLLGWQGNRREI